ncbi:MAG: hypothetical protein HOJ64_01095 [Euryarchaeota archaeon]|nr:hypothetical protein [Euryarchaeota archaeon]MBT4391755.1 hypothetical protein [Euryarchaeota archaeon]MBT4802111.1 hypothetical protein [Euryarchaeota archaeon]MBT5613453.1 hypothetical protein [Euryarchaeota archaeon]MBT7413725.1 hypothetical protein [Euryarchaeota archaeon]
MDESYYESDSYSSNEAGVSILYAQVVQGKPKMDINEKGFLEVKSSKKSRGIYLGDVAKSVLYSIGSHATPFINDDSNWDQQVWELICKSNDLDIKIYSSHYWGFGLFNRCFYNKIEIRGELSIRARCVHDIVASLGRNPWEPYRLKSFERVTNLTIEEHIKSWNNLIKIAKDEMNENILKLEDSVRSLRGVNEDSVEFILAADNALEEARTALSDRNSPAVERALSRAEKAIIRANPKTDLQSTNILFDDN